MAKRYEGGNDFLSDLSLDGKHKTLATAVYTRLREDILSAVLLPGEKLRLDMLRERYRVGTSPLREALNRLASEGLATQADQKGFRVAPVSVEELQELTRTRRLVNEAALRESMRNGGPDWEESVVLAYHRMTRAVAEDNKPERQRTHREFHRALIAGCGSKQLLQFSQSLFDRARRYRLLSISPAAAPSRNGPAEHRKIFDAVVVERDIDNAIRLLDEHVILTETIVLSLNALPARTKE